MIESYFKKRASTPLSNMLRRGRIGWEEKEIMPPWMDVDVFKERLDYWNSYEFKTKSKKAKKHKASENGATNHRTGNINITEHAQLMVIIFLSHYFF